MRATPGRREGDLSPEARRSRAGVLRAPRGVAERVLFLQRVAGNAAVARRLTRDAQPDVIRRIVTRYPTSSRGRVSKPPFDQAISGMDHIEAPSYENAGIANAGGRRSTAVLGPTGSLLGGGSDAVSTLPPAIGAARLRHPASSFKAGHLLNAEFGGSGSDPDNLTILSATGNANHKGFDNPVKRAVMFLRKAYYALWADDIDVSQLDLGIHVEIRVRTDLPWGGPPDHVIFQGLECEAALSDWAPLSSSFSRDPDTGEYSRWRNEFLDRVTDAEGELIDANFNNEVANRP